MWVAGVPEGWSQVEAIVAQLVAQGVSPTRLRAEAGSGPGVVFDVTD